MVNRNQMLLLQGGVEGLAKIGGRRNVKKYMMLNISRCGPLDTLGKILFFGCNIVLLIATTNSLYTVAEDTLDPDDPIYPRLATRVGPKFQATVGNTPDMGVTTTLGEPKTATWVIFADLVVGPDDRGENNTVESMSLVCHMDEEQGGFWSVV